MRALYSQVSPVFWEQTAERLSRCGIEPVYWLGPEERGGRGQEQVRRHFPGVILHNRFDATHNRWPPEADPCEDVPSDEPWLEGLANAEAIALRMMDRMDPDGRSFSYAERVRHFHNLVRRWRGVLERFSIELLVFQEVPGFVSEYVLSEVAKHLNVPQVFFARAWSHARIYPVADFEDVSPDLNSAYERSLVERPVELPATALEHLRNLRGTHEEAGSLLRALRPVDKAVGLRAWLEGWKIDARRITKSLRATPPRTWDKVQGASIEASRPGLLWSLVRARRERRQVKTLARAYERVATTNPDDLTERFVYLALHYQPEVTTSPMGGRFVDQEHVVRLVAASVPPDWRVVVKEHPATFRLNPPYQGSRGRRPRFYDDLTDLPNVRFVPVDTPTYTLIDSAAAVATVTGTVGWEAVARGTPAVTFGAAWYRPCEGVFDVRTRDELEAALGQIRDGFAVSDENVDRFVAALATVSVDATVHVASRHLVPPSAVEPADRLAATIEDHLRNRDVLPAETASPRSSDVPQR